MAKMPKYYKIHTDGCTVELEPVYEELTPVVHGRWVIGYPITCSVCGGYAATEYEDANKYEAWLSPYCPNCGAKMDVTDTNVGNKEKKQVGDSDAGEA